jgi:hypothetical protein
LTGTRVVDPAEIRRVSRVAMAPPDADPQVARGKVACSLTASPGRGSGLVKHAGWNQAEGGLAVKAAAKGFSSAQHGLLEFPARAVIQPEDA